MSKYLSPTTTTTLTFSSLLFYTSLITLIVDVMSARLPDIYWNSTNPIFRIDNTDHIIDVNRGNAAFEYDQINIICPMYSKGTREDDIETYIIYNVSKEEYDGCHIANQALARTIAVCDKPYLNRYYTVTFRPFTPQPGGLEFHPGQDYYFIALSAKNGDISNHCHKYHMKVVFKVCCGNNQQQQQQQQSTQSTSIVSKPEPVINNNGINAASNTIINNSTIAPAISSSISSTSMPQQSSTFSFVEFIPGHNNNPNNIGIATYKGVISNGVGGIGQQNSTMFPMIVRHPKPTRSSSATTASPISIISSMSNHHHNNHHNNNHHQSSSPYSNNNSNNNHDNKIGHRFYGDQRGGGGGGRYSNIPQHYPSLFSTERPSSHGSQINPVTNRIPHVPYHPYHPRQLTSTLRPVHVGWRPHPIPNNHHQDHNPPIRLSDQRSIGYKGIYRPNDNNREKSDGLNSHSQSTLLLRQSSTITILTIIVSISFWTSSSLL
uniref:Myb-like protein AA isoform X2 n=1 Tax=Dermatophagoides pteronyssinus TaxID=6956 RepID=A0A6P6XSM3_DERPT|nr:myb-like protein AA isoform X2 [Dermatophagoides pteronyssinus]